MSRVLIIGGPGGTGIRGTAEDPARHDGIGEDERDPPCCEEGVDAMTKI